MTYPNDAKFEIGCFLCGAKDRPRSSNLKCTYLFVDGVPEALKVAAWFRTSPLAPRPVEVGLPCCLKCSTAFGGRERVYRIALKKIANLNYGVLCTQENPTPKIKPGQIEAPNGQIGCICLHCKSFFSWVEPNRGLDYYCPDGRF